VPLVTWHLTPPMKKSSGDWGGVQKGPVVGRRSIMYFCCDIIIHFVIDEPIND